MSVWDHLYERIRDLWARNEVKHLVTIVLVTIVALGVFALVWQARVISDQMRQINSQNSALRYDIGQLEERIEDVGDSIGSSSPFSISSLDRDTLRYKISQLERVIQSIAASIGNSSFDYGTLRYDISELEDRIEDVGDSIGSSSPFGATILDRGTLRYEISQLDDRIDELYSAFNRLIATLRQRF
ncbi:hypothetical protein [Candidatus Poriferisodalis sp.]|uniref:hypothetical protein n=1 Tax=Candidatus Poriferisodalis sp. TaxID=3101277 RepID=UPI003B01D61E